MRFFAALRHSLRGYVAKSKAMVKEGHKNVTGATRNYEVSDFVMCVAGRRSF